jgi:hypothetical protein
MGSIFYAGCTEKKEIVGNHGEYVNSIDFDFFLADFFRLGLKRRTPIRKTSIGILDSFSACSNFAMS